MTSRLTNLRTYWYCSSRFIDVPSTRHSQCEAGFAKRRKRLPFRGVQNLMPRIGFLLATPIAFLCACTSNPDTSNPSLQRPMDDWTWYSDSSLLGIDLQEVEWGREVQRCGWWLGHFIDCRMTIGQLRRHRPECLEAFLNEGDTCGCGEVMYPPILRGDERAVLLAARKRVSIPPAGSLLDALRDLCRASGIDCEAAPTLIFSTRRAVFDHYWTPLHSARMRNLK